MIESLVFATELYLDSMYWQHWDMFPHHRTLSTDVLDQLEGVLLHGSVGESHLSCNFKLAIPTSVADTMTSVESTMPYSTDVLGTMLSLLEHMKCKSSRYLPTSHSAEPDISTAASSSTEGSPYASAAVGCTIFNTSNLPLD
jgi:hypothetical protein